jgi:MoxR-like ATPase
MTDKVGRGLRPHEVFGKKAGAPLDKDAPAPKEHQDLSPDADSAVTDVLEMTHRQVKEAQSIRFKKNEARAHLSRFDAVAKRDGHLYIGGEATVLKASHDAALTLLEPNANVITHITRGLASKEATLISAATGSGAMYTAKWLLEATAAKHEVLTVTRSTALDSLVGSMRPNENNKLRVIDGPLTKCVRDGGVFVLNGLENADAQIQATLRALAKGAKHFHHPISGQVIEVHQDFRLVIIGDQSKRFDKGLVEACNHREIRGYNREEHARLLGEQHNLTRGFANSLAGFHEALQNAESEGHLSFGRGFPLAWPMLSAAGARFARKKEILHEDVVSALWGVYGARLSNPDSIAAFEGLVAELKMGALEKIAPKKSKDPSFVHTPSIDRALYFAEAALNAGETVLMTHAGQSGATRLASELANRRGLELVTIIGHTGTDPQSLMETPVFNEKGELYFRPGRLAQALIDGKMLYVDHLDHMPRDRQNAFFQLQGLKTIKLVENGKIVEKPVHKNARILLSCTEGQVRGRNRPDAADRASATEVRLTEPTLLELMSFVPEEVRARPEVLSVVESFAKALHDENPKCGLTKLQRFIDFSRTVALLSDEMYPEEAALSAARLLFNVDPKKSDAYRAMQAQAEALPARAAEKLPLWMRLLELTPAEEKKRLAKTGYRITESMRPHLEALAVAYRLGRPVLAVGPASSGKTALGIVFSALVEKKNVRVNFSASTESRELLGGLGPVNERGKTVFRHIEGPEMKAAELESMLMADELYLSSEGQMALKPWIDHRRKVIDAEADRERDIGTAILYATTNPEDPKTGRAAPPPTILDCMFHIAVGAKPIDEKIEIVESQCRLPRELIAKTANFFADLEKSVKDGSLKSAVGPITCTERDMLKAGRTAEYLFLRDGVKDADEQRKILGREVSRLVRDMLLDDGERTLVFDKLVTKHFGKDVTTSPRPNEIQRVEGLENGGKVTFLQIGTARLPIRPMGDDPEVEGLVPDLQGVKDPVGEQLEFLESVLLALELKQPLAVVGNTGTGKTMLMKWLAHHLNMPWHEQPFHGDMTEDHLFGTTVISKDGNVEFQYAPLSAAIKGGGLFVGDEFLTLPNNTREKLNPVTEGSEIQISQKRPPETIEKKDWDPNFRFVVTTNGSDIRDDGFSDAEASRMRIVGLRELSSREDLGKIAQRDYVLSTPAHATPARNDENRQHLAAELKKVVDLRGAFGKTLTTALAASLEGGAAPELDKTQAPELQLDGQLARLFADVLSVFSYDKKDAPIRAVINALLEKAKVEGPELMNLTQWAGDLLDSDVRARADRHAVHAGKLLDPEEADRAVELFTSLREMQRASKTPGTSPLTPRIFSSFLDLFVQLRGRAPAAEAAQRAAELSLWSKLGPKLEAKATAKLVETFGANDRPLEKYTKPEQGQTGVYFGDTFIEYGGARPWTLDSSRFPPTPARCKNLTLLADAISLGKGRPISCSDDENGETVETLRELGRLTGRQITVVSLPPNVDIEGLIERLVASEKAEDKGGFEAELQQIGQAVKEGHILVLRGCGNVPTSKLERLNSLGDGRQGIRLPRSGDWLKAAPGFRMVMLRTPDAVHEYSPALQNRLIEPLLTTRSSGTQLDERAAELALAIEERTKISREAAQLLGSFHTYLNQLIRESKFASGRAVGSLLNRDAEAIGFRLKWLSDRNVVDDEKEMLAYLVNELYGERFLPEKDKQTLKKELDDWFGADWQKISLSTEINPSPHVMRVGDWVVQRDPGGIREGVPGPEAILPPTKSLDAVFQKAVAAAQFGEVIQLHGDEFVADACVNTLARITTSPVTAVEGNEELQEAYLFGGLIQDSKTGEFKEHEGLVWKAQNEGGTLLIKSASKIPAEVLTRLVEIAATRHVTRVHDGKLEVKKAAFKLVLQTSAGDPPLIRELGSLCTKVQCPSVSARADLKILLSHLLQGVPGAAELAGALETFSSAAADSLSERAQVRRQVVRFDSARLLKAARQIASSIKERNTPMEEALADVIGRLYLRPAEGLEIDEKLGALFDQMTDSLTGVLTLADIRPIDIVERPEISSLRKDYDEASPVFTHELLAAAAKSLEGALEKKSAVQLDSMLRTLLESSLVPQAAAARIEKSLEKLGPKLDPIALEDLSSLRRFLERAAGAAEEASFHDRALDFLRGSRMWDLEYRLAILARYETAFTALGAAGGHSAGDRIADITRVRERFDAAGAHQKLLKIRDDVGAAMLKYRDRAGEADDQLGNLLRDLLDKWHLVGTSPIFKNHHQLRNELTSLDQLLERLEEAHAARGADQQLEVGGLVEALRDAGSILEGLRIAEASAELRRGMKRAALDTSTLVDDVREELVEIRRLEGAERQHDQLSRTMHKIESILQQNDFLHLDYSKDSVDRPALRSDGDLRAEAERLAREEAGAVIGTRRMETFATMQQQNAPQKAPDPAKFFANFSYARADVGLETEQAAKADSPAMKLYRQAMAGLDAEENVLVARRSGELFKTLKKKDEDRVAETYRDRINTRARHIASQVQSSVVHLDNALRDVSRDANLAERSPDLLAELQAARTELEATSKAAHSWSRAVGEAFEEAGRVALNIMSFGFFGKKKADIAPADLALTDAQKRVATVLAKIQTVLAKDAGALPDFRKISTHKELTSRLTEQLKMVDTLGELAAKYARLSSIQEDEDNGDLKKWLSIVLGQMTNDRSRRDVLLRIDAFCTSANKLTSEVPNKGGVAVELAPALEAIMRAAEAIRTQPASAGSYRSSIKALKNALQKVDDVAAGQALPALIGAVRQEMQDLVDAFLKLSGEDVGNLDYDVSAVQEILRSRTKALDGKDDAADELRAVFDDAAKLTDEHEEAAAAAAANEDKLDRALLRKSNKRRAELEDESFARETKLQIIDLDFERARALSPIPEPEDDKKTIEPSEELLARREQVITSARDLEMKAVGALGHLERDQQSIGKLLKDLDDSLANSAIEHWRKELAGIAESLEKAAVGAVGGEGGLRGFNMRKPLEQLRKAARAVRALEKVPIEISSRLDTIVDAARPLEAVFGTDKFFAMSSSWCADAMLAAREVEGKLGELDPGAARGAEEAARLVAIFDALQPSVERLGNAEQRIGSWSRLSLTSHVAQRVGAIESVLPAGAKEAAAKLIESAQSAAARQGDLSLGTDAEQSAADAYSAYVDLASKLSRAKKLDEATIQTYSSLGEMLWLLLGPQGENRAPDLELLAKAIDLVERLTKAPGADKTARELSLSLGAIRSAALERALDDLEAPFFTATSSYAAKIKDARVRLFDATRSFLEYDPLEDDASIPDLSRALKSALVQSSEMMTGPAAVVLASEILRLRDGLENIIAEGGPMSADARTLEAELEPLLKGATELGKLDDAPDRFTAMVDTFTERTKKARASGIKREILTFAKEAGEALASLMNADHASLGEKLDRVEEDYFPELIEKRQPKVPVVVEERPAIKSRVEEMMGGLAWGTGSSARSAGGEESVSLRRVGGRGLGSAAQASAMGLAKGSGGGGGSQGTPPPIEGPYGKSDVVGTGEQKKATKIDRETTIGELGRDALPEGRITERSDKLRAIEMSDDDLRAMKKRMNEKLSKARKVEQTEEEMKKELLTEFSKFIADHEDLVNQLADTLRQHPGLETVVVVDQSGSTINSRLARGEAQIIEQERATLAIIMAAHMRAERNCAVVGFGSKKIGAAGEAPVASSLDRDHYKDVSIFVHKPMSERLDEVWADRAYGLCGNADGYTDLIEPMNVAAGQFTDRANNKLILVLTDAQIGNKNDVKRYIENRRAEGIGVAMMGFGAAQHIAEVAGDVDDAHEKGFGLHAHNFSQAITGGARLLAHTVVQNAGGYRGKVKSAAQGIGESKNQEPMRAPSSAGPMDCVLSMADPVMIGGDPGEAFGTRGPRREMNNLVDRTVYERALKELEMNQAKNAKTPKFRECMRQVSDLRARHEHEGIIDSLHDAVQMSLPKTRGAEWERKQLSGPLFDEEQLPMYVVGLAQGVPVLRIFKRKRPTEDTKATVVLAIDESSSMGDSEKMKAHIEAMIAYGDALKMADPDIKIAVVGFSDKVRLHAGFEQEWDDALKAHLLFQVNGNYDATDDERGGREAIGLLNMMDADVGQVVSFSDGQGMPGMLATMKQAAQEGYAFMTVGVTPDSKMVRRFDKHGVYARNLAQLPQVLPQQAVGVWEEAGRIIG